MKLHDLVWLKEDRASHGLSKGNTGTIVHLYADGLACEVEFPGGVLTTCAMDDILPVATHAFVQRRLKISGIISRLADAVNAGLKSLGGDK